MYNFTNFHPSINPVPNHIGIIPDGTRRWSKMNNINLTDGYRYAMLKLLKIIDFMFHQDVSNISIYLASTQNFKRSKIEIDAFCIAENFFIESIYTVISDNINVKIVGNKSILPDFMNRNIEYIENRIVQKTNKNLFLALAYNPFEELYKALVRSNYTEDFLNYLDVPIPLDLIIRTADANLLSNFMLLQSGFARFYTIEKLFNDTQLSDYELIIKEFKKIKRVYGQ